MYYRITDDAALRSWSDIGFAFYRRGIRRAMPLPKRQAAAMLLADGEHDMETDDTVMLLVLKKLIEPCERGERPSAWSAYRKYDNVCFPMMSLMITGKCNFNCLHCFNAADNAAMMTEWSFEDICDLLDQARDCGIISFQITGGEPMAHRRFFDIVREIYKRDMGVFALNTNGWYITQEALDELKAIGCNPTMKISFDGIGFHDWIRQREGAQKSALGAMELCLENGFRVVSNTQANRRNLHTMLPTARLLDSMGVQGMRIIRTTEAPRWEQNAAGACLSLEEYYSSMLDFATEYIHSDMSMDMETWQYIGLLPKERSYYLKPVKFAGGQRRDGGYCCNCTHSMIAVTSDAEIMPCNQMSGFFLKNGISLGNVRQTPLRDLLSGGDYVDLANMTVGDLRRYDGTCAKCPYFSFCGGGCRALARLFSGEPGLPDCEHKDATKCFFFQNGWYQKVTQALQEWTNLSDISPIVETTII